MPINYNHINQHVWQHAVSELIYAGPVFGHHMFPFEAGAGWLKSLLKSPKSPEEGLARAIASEWRTMLHTYDDQDVDTIATRLLAPKLRGTTPHVIEYRSYPTNLPRCKRTASAAERSAIAEENAAEHKLLHSYFLENDVVCKMVHDEFIHMHGGADKNEWKTFDIQQWVVSELSFTRINQQHLHAYRGKPITRQVIEHVKAGPVSDTIMIYKKIKINDTEFCDVDTDKAYKTTNCCIRYTVNNGKNAWTYARIKRIYRLRPYEGSTQPVTLMRLFNFTIPYTDSSQLIPLTQMSDADVIGSDDHLHCVPIEPECVVDDENLAYWPTENANEFYAVSYNPLKLFPNSF
jgi:hypothetical protein